MRYLRLQSRHERTTVFLAGGPIATRISQEGLGRTVVLDNNVGPLGQMRELLGVLRQADPDVIVSNSVRSGAFLSLPMFSRWSRILYVRQQIDTASIGLSRASAYRVIAGRHDGIMANSQWTRERVAAALQKKPTEVAYPISGVSVIDPARTPTGGKIRLAVIARFQEWKGQLEAVRALAIVGRRGFGSYVDLTLAGGVVFGSRQFLERCQEIAASCDSEVRFVGHVENVDDLLRSVDVLLHLPRIPEPFGQVVVQAMARGCVVVSEGKGGAGEILRGQPLAVYPKDSSPEAIADAIVGLVESSFRGQWPGGVNVEALAPYLDAPAAGSFDSALVRLLGGTPDSFWDGQLR